jgi:hypothetical protein
MPAFSRRQTFYWFAVFVLGLTVSCDFLGGISPVIRALDLDELAWNAIRGMLHSKAIDHAAISNLWFAAIKRMFAAHLVTICGRIVIVADGFKNPKEGRRMPGVKKMHQESANNSKPEFIRGHYFEALGLVVRGIGTFFCVPFLAKIHEGFKLNEDDSRSLKDKFAELVLQNPALRGCLLVADAWYAAKTIIGRIPADWNLAIVTRVAKNATAHLIPPPDFARVHRRGRKPKYGAKVKLMDLFQTADMQTIKRADASGNLIEIKYWYSELLWKPLGKLVRFVGSDMPEKGRIVLLATDITMTPEDVIQSYLLRSRIEVAFKVAVYTIGTFCYRMWSKTIERMPRWSETEHLWKRSKEYTAAYLRKIAAYELFVMGGLIAQGLLVYLSVCHPAVLATNLGTWFRTLRSGVSYSETVAAEALRTCLAELSPSSDPADATAKFLSDQIRKARERRAKGQAYVDTG